MPLAEHDLLQSLDFIGSLVSIHVPLAEHDVSMDDDSLVVQSFNSRAPRGARQDAGRHSGSDNRFNSRAPRGARRGVIYNIKLPGSFNSRAPRGARPVKNGIFMWLSMVSIHVPLAEHDGVRLPLAPACYRFNSRAPRGARLRVRDYTDRLAQFQFTCPSRSTTPSPAVCSQRYRFQFTCPSRSTTECRRPAICF